MNRELYQPDKIFAPAEVVEDLVRTYGTPFYLYDAAGLEEAAQALCRIFAWNEGFVNYVPVRENPNPAILTLLARGGCGASAANAVELELARRCGFSGERLLYAPMVRDPGGEKLARSLDAVWLIQAPDLLPETPVSALYLRCRAPGDGVDGAARRRLERAKTGFTPPQLRLALRTLTTWPDVRLGLALQTATYSLRAGLLAQRLEALRHMAQTLQSETGLELRRFYLGEGPGLPYRPNLQGPSLAEEAEALHAAAPSDATLAAGICKQILEPHGLLVTTVLAQRRIGRNFLVLDAGISQYLRPALRQAYRHISILGKEYRTGRRLWYVVGPTDEELDRLSEGRMLPDAEPGAVCILHDVGCGGRANPMLSVGLPVPPEFLYSPGGAIQPISPTRSGQAVTEFLYGAL